METSGEAAMPYRIVAARRQNAVMQPTEVTDTTAPDTPRPVT
jgi:hypothetical protein